MLETSPEFEFAEKALQKIEHQFVLSYLRDITERLRAFFIASGE